jgi:hypothetical protein
MSRKTFLTVLAFIAATIGMIATFAPMVILNSKGVHGNFVATIWVREVGVLLFAVGALNYWMRSSIDQSAIMAVLSTNLIIQASLLPIEVIAYMQGWLSFAGIAPNTILHSVLVIALAYYWLQARDQSLSPNNETTSVSV